MRVVLVHSPLVGPSTWEDVARVLSTRGHAVEVPDLRTPARHGDPLGLVDTARAAVPDHADAIVGHSGAGFFLPSIARSPDSRLVFVDAGLPPPGGRATASADIVDRLRAMAVDGVLPRWSSWWGDGVMEELVPDARRRAAIDAELVEVPLAFYETAIAIPDAWRDTVEAGYVLLSEAYRPDAASARSLGWPVVEVLGAHLDLVVRPEEVADAILRIASDT